MGLLYEGSAASRGHDLNVLHAVEHGKRAKGCPVAPELVGVHRERNTMFSHQPAEEGLSCLCVTVALKEDVQHSAVLQGGSPQPVGDASDIHMHFVEMPSGTPSGFPMAEALGEQVTEGDVPGADRFPGHADPTFQQRFWQLNRGETQKPGRRPDIQAACCNTSRQRSRAADWLLLLTDAGTVVRVWR